MERLRIAVHGYVETLSLVFLILILLLACVENLMSPGLGEGVDYLPPSIQISYPQDDGLAFKTNDNLQPVILSGTWSDNEAKKGASITVRWMEQDLEVQLGNFTQSAWSINLNQAFGATFNSAAGAQNFRVIVTDAAGNKNHASRFLIADNHGLSVV